MAKAKSTSKEYTKEGLAQFLTDLEARSKGVANGVRFWDTLGTAGKEPVGNLGFSPGLLDTENPAAAFFPALRKGEVNPYLEVAGENGRTSKKMYEYFASAARPQLPKELKGQYDVVFAGTREADPSEEVWNTKTGSRWSQGPQNIWQFVPKQIEDKVRDKEEVSPAVSDLYSSEEEGDRPVQVGTLTYVDPSREKAGQEFLSHFVRSIGMPQS